MTFLRLSSFKKVLTVFVDWADTWQLKLCQSKFQHMRVSLRKTTIPSTYSLCGNILPSVLECIDLGVYVDCALSFSNHISTIVTKAKLRSSQILRFFLSKDPVVLAKAFVVYVRPILEYSSPVWSPYGVSSAIIYEKAFRNAQSILY